jgi:tetratricopeptide (TPR) repeat protein
MASGADLNGLGSRLAQLGDLHQVEQDFQQLVQVDPNNPHVYFILGALAHREDRNEAAVDALGKAIALDPSNPDYHCVLGSACTALGRMDTAAEAYREAIRLRPDELRAHEGLGNILVMQGRHDDAIASFRRLLTIRPGHATALASLASSLMAQGRLDEVTTACRQALHHGAESADAHKNLALVAMQKGRLDEAAAAFQDAIRIRSDDPETRNDLGVVLARMGRRDEAEASYREALRIRPDFADAHNNLGNVLRNRGRHDEAVACFREALRLRPDYPEAYNNLGITLRAQGKLDESIAHYQRALALRPTYAEALNNMGFALAHRGKPDAAIICYQQAARLKANYFEANHNLGNALSEQGRHDEGIVAYHEALRIRPDEPRVLKCLAITLSRREKFDEAVTTFRQALKLRPDYADAWNDLGITLARQSKHKEAADAYHEAIKFRPNYAEAFNNLGNALRCIGKFDESTECYRKALEHKPQYADAYNNYGIALSEMGRFEEAVASYTRCLELRPNHVDAHMNRALTWLRKGDYAQGWAEYEWRWKKRPLSNRPLIQPQWNGFPLKGRTVLLITEQGFGDVLQFIRYAPVLKAQGARVIFECPEKLIKLLEGSPGVDVLLQQGAPLPPYDVYAPLLTVPGLVGTSLDQVPNQVPYLHPDPKLVEKWRDELSGYHEFKVGINWQGNPKYAGDFHRSIPLKCFEPLARVPGVRLFSLQKNDGIDQLAQIAGKFEVTELGSRLDVDSGPFRDTAAVLKCLDLFVTSDTAVAHLAGALGVPVWMPLSTTPDWRWLSAREDNPWYPTMRIFRQETFLDWTPVFDRIATELRRKVPDNTPTPSVVIEAAPGELIDKITILEIKTERIQDPEKLRNVRTELATLRSARDRTILPSEPLAALTAELKSVNEALWTIEDEVRTCEREGDFGPKFVELARSVYKNNDHRAALKRQINERLGSRILEEKSYAATA